jgi:anti-anti-sigma factor
MSLEWFLRFRGGQIMTELFEERAGPSYRCPVCDVTLAAEPALPTYDTPCPDCGYQLWCRKRKVDDVVLLSVLPDRTAERADIERLAESLVRSCHVLRVVIDLSGLEFISSAMIAELLALRKRVLAAKGRLVLCGLSPYVQTIFSSTQIERLFEIVDAVTDAVSTFNSVCPAFHSACQSVKGPK